MGKYFLFFLLFLVACAHIPNKNKEYIMNQHVNLPLTLHFNHDYNPKIKDVVNQLKFMDDVLLDMNVDISVENVKYDAPKIAYINRKNRRFFDLVSKENKIHIFFVKEIKNIKKNEIIRGIQTTAFGKRYIIIPENSLKSTLIHELGHYFSLKHVKEKNNIMNGTDRNTKTKLILFEWQVYKMKKAMLKMYDTIKK